jgi:acetamidase/formamidase
MGDGEVCGTGVETAARARLRFDVLPGTAPAFPVIDAPRSPHRSGGSIITTGIGPDLMIAARDCVRSMIDELTRRTTLSPEQAYLLASLSADLIISEIVDAPNWVVSLHVPTDVLE